MSYVLPIGAFENLKKLWDEYQAKEKVLLDKKHSFLSTPTLFGGTDRAARKSQIELIEKMQLVLSANIKDIDDITNPLEALTNLSASKTLLAVCMYVKSKIPHPHKNSTLCTLINAKLGINEDNTMDNDDKKTCCLAANRLFSLPNAFEEANAAIAIANKPLGPMDRKYKPLTEEEWKNLTQFFTENINTKQIDNSYTNFPISSLTRPLFGAVFSYAGATAGIVTGDALSHSTNGYRLTAVLGSSMLILAPTAPASMVFFAPVIASKLINTFCKVSLAHVLSVIMGGVGQAIGLGVGLPFDMVIYGLRGAINKSFGSSAKTKPLNQPDGLRISDGRFMISNVAFELLNTDSLPNNIDKKILGLDEEGYMLINGQRAVDPITGKVMPKYDLDLLNEAVSLTCQKQMKPVEITSACQL